MSGPWTFHLHPVALGLVAAGGVGLGAVTLRHRAALRPRQVFAGVVAVLLALVAFQWPLADLAQRWSLAALVVQRLVLMVGLPGLLLVALPEPFVATCTRPAVVDGLLRRTSRPLVSIVVVTAIAVSTLSTAAVDGQAHSAVVRAGLDLLLLVAGTILWVPAIGRLPAIERPSPLGRAAYLVAQSVVPSFLAIVWIFARHPLYPVYVHPPSELGWAPVTDQEIAGFVAKLGTIFVLWTVAFVVLSRSLGPAEPAVEEPLTWADVERHLQRAERAERSERSRRRASRWSAFLPDFGDPAARRSPGGTAPGEPTDEPGPAGHG